MNSQNYQRLFERFNADQMQADRAVDRIYTWSLIAGLAFAGLCIAAALSLGVQ
jgi:hypothetical protein